MPDYSSVEALNTDVLLRTLVAFKKGDFSVRLPVTEVGIEAKIADTLNDIFEMNERTAKELDRISDTVGKEGKIEQRASLAATGGGWSSSVESVNTLIGAINACRPGPLTTSAKPVDLEHLFSVMRVWIAQRLEAPLEPDLIDKGR